MAFTVGDFQDLIRLLGEHPEWRAELRRHVLSNDLIELPALVRQLAEAQARMARWGPGRSRCCSSLNPARSTRRAPSLA